MPLYKVTEIIENTYIVEALSEHKAIRAVLDNLVKPTGMPDIRVPRAVELTEKVDVWEDSTP